MAYETIEIIANTAARPGTPTDGMIRYQQDIQSCIVYDDGASAWKVFTPDAAPYDLDGTTIMDTTPLFHFDADKFNGTDDTGNPDDEATVDGTWTSRTNGITAAQGTGGYQPTYNTGGANGEPYVTFVNDNLDVGVNSIIPGHLQEFTFFGFMNRTGSNIMFGGSLAVDTDSVWNTCWMSGTTYNYTYYPANANLANSHPDIDDVPAELTIPTGGDPANGEQGRMFILTRDESNVTKMFIDGNNRNTDFDGDDFDGTFFAMEFIGAVSGSGSQFRGYHKLYEMAFWNSELSSAEKNKLITYVNSRYGTGRDGLGTGTFERVAF